MTNDMLSVTCIIHLQACNFVEIILFKVSAGFSIPTLTRWFADVLALTDLFCLPADPGGVELTICTMRYQHCPSIAGEGTCQAFPLAHPFCCL